MSFIAILFVSLLTMGVPFWAGFYTARTELSILASKSKHREGLSFAYVIGMFVLIIASYSVGLALV